MTPAARIAAAIAVLDEVLAGDSAERVLTSWARRSRFAGSGDRAAIRDHVYDGLRRLRSSAALGGSMTGRGVMIGLLRGRGQDPRDLFTGQGHAPPPLGVSDATAGPADDPLVSLDCPEWLAPELQASLGDGFAPVMRALQDRAPVFLRVNLARGDVDEALASLAADGIAARPGPLSPTAIEVTGNPRRVQASAAYRDGVVEVQDASSQAAADAIPVAPGWRVLDYCAGGGGKTLALAGRCAARYFACDADPRRMADLPARAARAGLEVTRLDPADLGRLAPFDLVVVDAPCSGSGAWRRAPQSKWTLDAASLDRLRALQAEILSQAARHVSPGGTLAYLTCSLLASENGEQARRFLRAEPGWTVVRERSLTPLDGGDGFYLAIFTRSVAV